MITIFQIALLLFFLGFSWMVFRRAEDGVCAIIFLLPLYLVRFSLGGVPTTMLEIMIYLLFLGYLLEKRGRSDLMKSLCDLYGRDRQLGAGLVLLLTGVILSTLHSVDPRASLGILKGWFIDPLLFFMVFIGAMQGRRQLGKAYLSLLGSGLGVALLGFGYALNSIYTFDGRLRAFYESPNYLAMYLAPAFLLASYLFLFKRTLPWARVAQGEEADWHLWGRIADLMAARPLQLFILSVIALAIFLTRSYGTMAGLVAALVWVALRNYRKQKMRLGTRDRKRLLAAAGLLLAIFSFLSYQKYEQVAHSHERSSFHSRLMIWDAARAMLADSPVFGIGPGTFQEVYLSYQSRFSTPYLEWAVAEPHNTPLAFYLESGLVGLIGFLFVLYWMYLRAKSDDFVLLFLLYFLVHGLVDTLYWKNDLAVIFFLVLSVAAASVRLDGGGKRDKNEEKI